MKLFSCSSVLEGWNLLQVMQRTSSATGTCCLICGAQGCFVAEHRRVRHRLHPVASVHHAAWKRAREHLFSPGCRVYQGQLVPMNLQGVNFLDQPVATPGSGSWGGFPSPTPGRRPSFLPRSRKAHVQCRVRGAFGSGFCWHQLRGARRDSVVIWVFGGSLRVSGFNELSPAFGWSPQIDS